MSAAPPVRRRGRSALERLVADARHFSFDAAVRLLSFARRQPGPAEAARFSSIGGAAYSGSEVTAVSDPRQAEPPSVSVGLIGLTGPNGVLPAHYSDAALTAQRNRSPSLPHFLDLLAHRMIAAFAAAGAKYRLHRAADTHSITQRAGLGSAQPPGGPVGGVLLALTGYDIPGFEARLPAGTAPLQHYAGLFSAHPRSADRLEAMISDWLERPVAVRQFTGAWLPLPADQRSCLPVGLAPGVFNRLGEDAAIGIRAWDQQARILLSIGPLDLHRFEHLLPDGAELRRLVSLVRAFVGFEVGFAVNLLLDRDAVPPLVLDGPGGATARLGWNTWLPQAVGERRRTHAADAVFEAELVEAQPARDQ
ncbi:type VI secretion system baseplate subunit TssG [Roseomonas xinghualingensis]|uniref:type VI secretion system baseplate subunit TssG n=1 Tax=Roseomonas xinghualingensis TaxID=2986475 RepID=UPI0021F15B63|nr:type VI secretion system baseplate subunit TssG [Roseomonas sp. SXEYE001]MCV4209666.1 type VI secretion system baseplate subunit TssG [Roseomonas sp. SXEYE001]